jgi:hypothetical protein
MRLLKFGVLCAALLVAGCASDYRWQRRDGGPLGESFQWAIGECRRVADRQDEEVMRRCMYRRGYVWAAAATEDDDYYRGRHHRRHHHDDDDDY